MYADYIWERFYWVPFFGWVFYFTLGYYCGYYYEAFVQGLKKWRAVVLAAPVASSALLLFFYHSEWLAVHSSKRIDMLFHTTAVGFCLFYLAHQLRSYPGWILTVSQYSFGLYLLHMFYLSMLDFLYQFYPINVGFAYILVLFGLSTIGSIYLIYWVTKWKYGAYLVGRVGIQYAKRADLVQNRKGTRTIASWYVNAGLSSMPKSFSVLSRSRFPSSTWMP